MRHLLKPEASANVRLVFILLWLGIVPQLLSAQQADINDQAVDLSLFFPEGAARPYVLGYCVSCHDLSRIIVQHKDMAGWENSIRAMIGNMASDEQLESITLYLTEHFGTDNPITAFPVNINSASVQELARLPYLDTSDAQAIVYSRSKTNGFNTPQDLVTVIGSEKLANVYHYLTTR